MNYENLDYDGVPWETRHTLKKAILKPGQELREMTICTRTYSLAYNKNGVYSAFLFHDGIPLTIETNGDTELIGKSMSSEMLAPGRNHMILLPGCGLVGEDMIKQRMSGRS